MLVFTDRTDKYRLQSAFLPEKSEFLPLLHERSLIVGASPETAFRVYIEAGRVGYTH